MNIITKIFILYWTCCSFAVTAQNLIQNGGFESNSGFPVTIGQWSLAHNWNNANSLATTDYLHTNGSGVVQLPNSVFGIVNPFQGSAVMGLVMWAKYKKNFREYISQHLTAPLTLGSSYTFSFYISNGIPQNYGGAGNYGGSGIQNVQVDFSISPIDQIDLAPLGYTPLLSSGTIIYSSNWIPVSYTFIATAPYSYFAIGNFMNDANTVSQEFIATEHQGAYYFIDEVSLKLNTGNYINIIGDYQICLGDSAILQASNSSVFRWANSLNPNIIIDNDSILIDAPAITTTYLLYGSNDTISYTVNVISPPSINLGNDTSICQGQSIILNGSSANSNLWSNDSTASSINVSSSGTYWLQANNGQCSVTDSIVISVNQYPSPNLGNDTTLCQLQYLTLKGGVATSYLWSNSSTDASISVSTSGTYWVQASNGQCSNSDTLSLLTSICEIEIELPNVFSPNNDGVNDSFIPIKYKGILKANLIIYNRWGEKLFYTDNLILGWNGSYKNNNCSDGTYFWTVQYTTIINESKELKGYLTLIK